ncbi:hypothetical protein [Allobranchiibius sp. GilTou73]|uniref:hypothetical protein n=1 Tax=Allobranchiibius sp. GilTou73 TaxID=2904523 RepID=UPI001F2F60DA|nr:hypothetical protein [Allobranchiibius sp. GilTou73]UIJ34498.1 hypothetical protein LVQ62_15515 [Allobranchiibius sp. GilTou73]
MSNDNQTPQPIDYVGHVQQMIRMTTEGSQWWWRANDVDDANELLKAAVVEAAKVRSRVTEDSRITAELNAVGVVRAFLPGHQRDEELNALEPDNLADAVVALQFLAACYAQSLLGMLPIEHAEGALDDTVAHLLRAQRKGSDR